jgi:hypothetical protein
VTPADVISRLVGSSSEFEEALPQLRPGSTEEFLARLLSALSCSDIPPHEQERRFVAVHNRVGICAHEDRSVAIAARSVAPVLRNAVLRILPAEFRQTVYGDPDRAKPGDSASKSGGSAPISGRPVDATIETQAVDAASDVLVLSSAPDIATMKLLEGAEFGYQRCSSPDELHVMLERNSEICGILVETSYLDQLTSEQQRDLFVELATFSTFTFIRIPFDGLKLSHTEVSNLISHARCQTALPGVDQLAFREASALQGRELSDLRHARNLLTRSRHTGLFAPAELKDEQLRLLAAALGRYSDKKHFARPVELSSVTTRFLQGNDESAKVVLAKVKDLDFPVVVKLFDKELILEEARRFRHFIEPVDHELNPEVHLHGSAAAIVFDVIADSDVDYNQPAPTLEQQLRRFLRDETYSTVPSGESERLCRAFQNAVQKICKLNKKVYDDTGFECWANPHIEFVKAKETNDFSWGFGANEFMCRTAAENLLSATAMRAICHGDAHIRNILVRGNNGFVIDYAYSGPGHPCSDLTRLELSIFLSMFVPYGGEAQHIELQRDVSIRKLCFEDLVQRHGALLPTEFNRLCLRLCVTARDAVDGILSAHGLDWRSYLAAKLLSAWQGLLVPALQQPHVRSVILSLNTAALFD